MTLTTQIASLTGALAFLAPAVFATPTGTPATTPSGKIAADKDVAFPHHGKDVTFPRHGKDVTFPRHGKDVTFPRHGKHNV